MQLLEPDASHLTTARNIPTKLYMYVPNLQNLYGDEDAHSIQIQDSKQLHIKAGTSCAHQLPNDTAQSCIKHCMPGAGGTKLTSVCTCGHWLLPQQPDKSTLDHASGYPQNVKCVVYTDDL